MIKANEKQFDENLKRIGDLYEEGKDCLVNVYNTPFDEGVDHKGRLYEILREMRDIAAVNLKSNYDTSDN